MIKDISRRILVSEFLCEAIPIYALMPLMFAGYGHMNPLQVGSLLAIWQMLIVVFELPTGIVADRFSRKASLSIGKALRVICYPIWLLFPSYVGLLGGIIFLSLGDALISGALEAYSYDELHDKKEFNRLRQRTVAVHLAAFTTAGMVAYLLHADYKVILVWSSIISILGFLASFLLPTDIPKSTHSAQKLISRAGAEFRKSRSVLRLFIGATIILAIMFIFIDQLNLFYKATGISDSTVALLMTGGNLITFILFWFSHKIERIVRKVQLVLLVASVVALLVSVIFELSGVVQVALVFVFVRVVRLATINYSNDLHHRISSVARATVGSMSSFIAKIITSASMLIIGYFADHTVSVRVSMSIIGLLLVIVLVATFNVKPDLKRV